MRRAVEGGSVDGTKHSLTAFAKYSQRGVDGFWMRRQTAAEFPERGGNVGFR